MGLVAAPYPGQVSFVARLVEYLTVVNVTVEIELVRP